MEKNTVRIQNVILGAGIPKVCVPVMGKDLREWTGAATAAREQADLIELRLDSVSPELDADRVRQACRVVREKAQGSALLATMRTSRDGGAGDGDAERYETLLVMLARERLCDALDVELSVGEAAFARIAQEAHAAGVPVVGSYHDFGGTPENAEMLARLHAMGPSWRGCVQNCGDAPRYSGCFPAESGLHAGKRRAAPADHRHFDGGAWRVHADRRGGDGQLFKLRHGGAGQRAGADGRARAQTGA